MKGSAKYMSYTFFIQTKKSVIKIILKERSIIKLKKSNDCQTKPSENQFKDLLLYNIAEEIATN